MRGVLLGLLAGCGRFGFGDHSQVDAAADAAADAVSGLVVAYSMDDDPSTGTIHGSVPGYDCACTFCPISTPGRIGNAYSFDGTNHFSLPANASMVLGPPGYTLTMWIKPTSIAQGSPAVVLGKPYSATSNSDVINLFVNNGAEGDLFFETTVTGTDYSYISQQSGGTRGAWHHVAASWDGTTKRLYIDGALVASAAATGLDSNALALVGADVDMGTITLHYTGLMDELDLFDRALTDAEVAVLATP